MSATEWLEVDEDGNAKNYGLNEWLKEVLIEEGECAEAVVDDPKEILVEEVDKPVPILPVMHVQVEESLAHLSRFLQQAPIDGFPLLYKLKAINACLVDEGVARQTQSTLHRFFDLNVDNVHIHEDDDVAMAIA